MSTDGIGLDQRGYSLEEAFFEKENKRLLEDMRKKNAAEKALEALSQASGIRNFELLGQIHEIGLGPETLAALSLVPLVEVAWADGSIRKKERATILKAARDSGLPEESSHQVLERWLTRRPDLTLLELWKEYVSELLKGSPEIADGLRREVLGRAEEVATTSRPVLGRKISNSERRVLDDLARAFES